MVLRATSAVRRGRAEGECARESSLHEGTGLRRHLAQASSIMHNRQLARELPPDPSCFPGQQAATPCDLQCGQRSGQCWNAGQCSCASPASLLKPGRSWTRQTEATLAPRAAPGTAAAPGTSGCCRGRAGAGREGGSRGEAGREHGRAAVGTRVRLSDPRQDSTPSQEQTLTACTPPARRGRWTWTARAGTARSRSAPACQIDPGTPRAGGSRPPVDSSEGNEGGGGWWGRPACGAALDMAARCGAQLGSAAPPHSPTIHTHTSTQLPNPAPLRTFNTASTAVAVTRLAGSALSRRASSAQACCRPCGLAGLSDCGGGGVGWRVWTRPAG